METSKRSRMPILAASEWVMVLPAAVFIAAAGLRELQPRQYEPARTSWVIFDWAMKHVSQAGAAVLFVGLPLVVAILGCLAVGRAWRVDEDLRKDVAGFFRALRRYAAVGFVVAATLLGGAISALAIIHVLTD